MTTDFSGTTAKIYNFPPRGRFAPNAAADETRPAYQSPRDAKVASGSGWYHDEAIEAETGRKI